MKDLANKVDALKNLEQEIYTTKDLKEGGLSKYYIMKLVDDGLLTRIKRGQYKINAMSKEANHLFNRFKRFLNKRDYINAYDTLVKRIKICDTHEFDNHNILYLYLLKELIPQERFDFSIMNTLNYYYTDKAKPGEYFYYYQVFCEAVLENDLETAYHNLKIFKRNEKLRKGENNLSTILFNNLLTTIHLKKLGIKPELKPAVKVEVKEEIKIDPLENSKNYFYYFELLKNNIGAKAMAEALVNLEEVFKYAYPPTQKRLKYLKPMLETYLDMQTNKSLLDVGEYSRYGDNYYFIYEKALENKDYITAFKNSGKVKYFNKKSHDVIFDLMTTLLHEIYLLNEENKKLIDVPEVKEELTSEELETLLYNREYDEAKRKLDLFFEDKNNSNRSFYYARKLLIFLKQLNNYTIYDLPNIKYNYYDGSCFQQFFDMLKTRDYRSAFETVDECIEKCSKKDVSDLEFVIYRLILEDIVLALDEYDSKKDLYNALRNLEDKINNYIYQRGGYTEDDLTDLKSLILEKEKILKELSNSSLNQGEINVLSLITTRENLVHTYGDFASYFARFNYSIDLVDKYNEAMACGDYATAFETINNPEFRNLTAHDRQRKYYEIIKKLLWHIHNNVAVKRENKKEEIELITDDVDYLRKIRSYLKKRDFQGAYNYYLEHPLTKISTDLKQEMDIILLFLKTYEKNEQTMVLEDMDKKLKRGDFSSSKLLLDEYASLIKDKETDYNLDYRYEQILLEEKRIKEPNFVKLEQLYDEAKYLVQQQDFANALNILNEYISLDKDMSSKGYVLRAYVYHQLKHDDLAILDYEEAIKISHEPQAYYYLGNLYYKQVDYVKALQSFLAYEARQPQLNHENLLFIAEIYKMLGDEENSSKYYSLSKRKE